MPDENTFELPETLPTDAAELATLETQARQAFQTRYDRGATTSEDLAELQAIAEKVRTVTAAITKASEQVEEPADPAEPVEPEAPAAPEPDVPVEPVTPEVEAPSAAGAVLDSMLLTTPVASTPSGSPAAPAEAAPAVAPAASVEALVAAANALTAAAGGLVKAAEPPKPAPVVEEAPVEFEMAIASPTPMRIVASADIPGVSASTELNGWEGLVDAIAAKAGALSVARIGTDTPSHRVASIMMPWSADRNIEGLSYKDANERMQDLSSPAFLLASGGWCAPSETIYDFACEVEAPPDMVTLPTGTTSRGGVRFPISPTFGDFMALENNGLFTWTEADDISALDGSPTKPCFHIPCVTFDEARLELEGLCVTAGNLTELAYPELIRRYMSLVLTGHLHRMNTQKILKMLAFVDDTVVLPATFAAASAILDGLSLQVADLRDQYSMSEGAVIEAMAPRWLKGPIRSDVARRECCGLDTVSDSDIRNYLQDAGIALQFVSNWQGMGDPEDPATVWPETVNILLWLPGALRELRGPKLDIAVARDSILNATNDHTVAFTEESYQVYNPGCGVRLATIPFCPNGASGERVALLCGES